MHGTTQRRGHRVLALAAILAASACVVRTGNGQVVRRAVRVQVADSSGAPLGGVDVVVLTVRRDTLGRGTTGDDGRALIAIDSGSGDRQVVGRKIGFSRSDLFIRITQAETLSVTLRMRRAVQTLAPVTVTEQRRLLYNFINADEIDSMSAHRTIYEARDIVLKLRPDMMNGSHCAPSGARRTTVSRGGRVTRMPNTELGVGVTIWVNGRRIFSPGMPSDSVLAAIRAEHVAEIKYESCFSTTVNKMGAGNAIFVTLKPGIAFDLKNGSFIADQDSMIRAINRKP